MNIGRKIRTFGFILRRSPLQAFELAQIKIEHSLGFSLFYLSPPRLVTRAFELLQTRRRTQRLTAYGNYYLAPDLIPERPVVLSFGVGQDIAFDTALLQRHKPDLFLFDPTPKSRRFIDDQKLPANVRFFPLAVTDRDGEVRVYSDDLDPKFNNVESISIFNRGYYASSISSVPCRKLKTILDELSLARIDILKLDIEGAGIIVLRDMLRDGIRPTQIACELERPVRASEVIDYLRQVGSLFKELRGNGYQIYRTREMDKGCQIEIVAVRA